jgi:hypothetical protein
MFFSYTLLTKGGKYAHLWCVRPRNNCVRCHSAPRPAASVPGRGAWPCNPSPAAALTVACRGAARREAANQNMQKRAGLWVFTKKSSVSRAAAATRPAATRPAATRPRPAG